MIKSLYSRAFGAGKPVTDALKETKRAGFQGMELVIDLKFHPSIDITEEDCKKILEESKKAAINITSLSTGIAWKYSLTDDDPKIREKSLEYHRRYLQIANWLEQDTVLFIPGAVDILNPEVLPVSYEIVYKRSIEAIHSLLPLAEKLRISLAIENVWNKFLLSPLEMRDYIDQFKTEYVSAYVDVANMLPYGYPEHWIKILGKRIKRIHFKDFKKSIGTVKGFCRILKGDVNYPEVMKSLRDINYNGPVTAEIFDPDEIDYTSKAMDKILEM